MGVGVGLALGSALGNPGTGLAIGIALGAGIGATLQRQKKTDKNTFDLCKWAAEQDNQVKAVKRIGYESSGVDKIRLPR
jgi:hypothetical protein